MPFKCNSHSCQILPARAPASLLQSPQHSAKQPVTKRSKPQEQQPTSARRAYCISSCQAKDRAALETSARLRLHGYVSTTLHAVHPVSPAGNQGTQPASNRASKAGRCASTERHAVHPANPASNQASQPASQPATQQASKAGNGSRYM